MKRVRQDECVHCDGTGFVECEKYGGIYEDICRHCKRVVTVHRWTETFITDDTSVISGLVISDSCGEFQPGWHCHSTSIIDKKEDDFGNITFETKNSFYTVVGKGNSDPVANKLGKSILGVFY